MRCGHGEGAQPRRRNRIMAKQRSAISGMGILVTPFELLRLRDSGAFLDDDELVSRDSGKCVDPSVGPFYGEVRRGADSETEVEPAIVHRVEAGLRGELLQLLVSAILSRNPASDGAPVALCAD